MLFMQFKNGSLHKTVGLNCYYVLAFSCSCCPQIHIRQLTNVKSNLLGICSFTFIIGIHMIK